MPNKGFNKISPFSERQSIIKRYYCGLVLIGLPDDRINKEHDLCLDDISGSICQRLLEKRPAPKDTIFRDDIFRTTCDRLQGKNEARIIKDFTPLLDPSTELLATLGAKHLSIVIESVNEGWNNRIPVTRPRPQPDYAVGFGRAAFSDDQLSKL